MLNIKKLLRQVRIGNNRPKKQENAGHVTFRPFNALIKSLELLFQDHQDQIDAGSPAKVYRALLNQSGTDEPEVTTVFENTFGSDPVFGYTSAGSYTIALTGVVEEKTIFTGKANIANFFGGQLNLLKSINYGINGTDSLYINTYDNTVGNPQVDGVLDGYVTYIEILVYP